VTIDLIDKPKSY